MKRGEGGTGTYAAKHVPKWFFIGVGLSNQNRFRQRYTMDNLCRREMITLKGGGMTGKVDAIGLTSKPGLIPTFVGAGDFVLALPGPEVARLNTLTRITYTDPRVLLSRGARGIRRISGADDTMTMLKGVIGYLMYYGLRQAGYQEPTGILYPISKDPSEFAHAVASNWYSARLEINAVLKTDIEMDLLNRLTSGQASINRPSEFADFLFVNILAAFRQAVVNLRAKKVRTLQPAVKKHSPSLSVKNFADAVDALEHVPPMLARKLLIPLITSLGEGISEGYANEEEWLVNPDRANGDVVLRMPVGTLFFPISNEPDLGDINDMRLYYANLQFAGFRVFKPLPYTQIESILRKTTEYLDKTHAVTPSESVAQKYRDILRTVGGQLGRQQEPRAEIFDRSPMWWSDTYR